MIKKRILVAFSISILCRLSFAQSIIVLPKYDEIGYYSEGMASVKMGNLWGFIDMVGNNVISPTYMEVHEFHEGVAAVKTQKGWGYINKNNQFVIISMYAAQHNNRLDLYGTGG